MWGAQKRSKTRLKNTPCKNAFKKHPLQNRTNVQIKGGGVKGLLNNVQKNCTFLKGGHPLVKSQQEAITQSQSAIKSYDFHYFIFTDHQVLQYVSAYCWSFLFQDWPKPTILGPTEQSTDSKIFEELTSPTFCLHSPRGVRQPVSSALFHCFSPWPQ